MNDKTRLEKQLEMRRQEAVSKANRNMVMASVRINRRDWLDSVVGFAMLLDAFINRVRERRYQREVDRVLKQNGLK